MSGVSPPMLPAATHDRLNAIACVLCAAILAVPMTLAGELEPEVSAAGWWALCALAPALVLVVGGARSARPWTGVFSAFVMLAFLSRGLAGGSDTLQSDRATLCMLAALAAFAAGSTLGGPGRRLFARLLPIVSLAYAVPALAGVAPRFQGALLNSGATSEVALLGALCASALALDSRVWTRRVAFLSVIAFGAFVGAAPVIAGAIAFLAPAALLWLARRAERRWIGLTVASFLLAAGAGYGIARATAPAPEAASSVAVTSSGHSLGDDPGGNLGGVAVRVAIAPRAVAMFLDHPWLGVGPGQFRAAFPPYRSADERVRSTAASQGRETEVEHAHDDVLTMLAELGLLGGGLWIVLHGLFAWRAWRALGSGDLARVAVALAVLGAVAAALLRSPLSFDPAASSLFYAAAGACLAADDPWLAAQGRAGSARLFALLVLALLALQAPTALALVRHGRALRLPDGLDLSAALTARPDSPLALALAAREVAADPARRAEALPLWERVLARRPQSFEARVQAGVLAAESGRAAEAREHWTSALALAPERTFLLDNLLLLEARRGEDADFAAALARAAGRVERQRLATLGANEVLSGDERAGRRLLAAAGVLDPALAPQALYDRAAALPAEGPARDEARALEVLAHLGWAREHAAQRDFGATARSLRQALRHAPSARAWRLELAAALWSADDRDAARAEIERADPRAADWAALAPWAGEILFQAGLFATR